MSSYYSTVLHKRNSTPGVSPSVTSLSGGEIALNDSDGILFIKSTDNRIFSFSNDHISGYVLNPTLSGVVPRYGNNQIVEVFSNVLGGYSNYVDGAGSTIVNGESNKISKVDFAFVGTGIQNTILSTGDFSAILGGHDNLITHRNCFVLGTNLSSHAENFTYVNNISGMHWGDGSNLRNVRDTTKLYLSGGTLTGGLSGTDAYFTSSIYSPDISGGVYHGDGSLLTGVAKLFSPAFEGIPTAPTATAQTNTTQIATTEFVMANRGDKYLSSSTTSLELLNNQTYSLTAGIGLSYTAPQTVTLAHDATHYMDAEVVSYNSSTGAMVVTKTSKTGTGTYASWTVNVKSTPVAGGLLAANNLSDVISTSAALVNLGGFPRTGGTLAGGLTATIGKFENIVFIPSASALSYEQGKVFYDSIADSLCYYNLTTNNKVHVGQEIQQQVKNSTNATIPKGTPVYITGAFGEYAGVAPAKADTVLTSIIVGVTNQDILSSQIGFVVTAGSIDSVDTSDFVTGGDMYLSPLSAGKMTHTLPSAPDFAVQIGVCLYAHATNGKMVVNNAYIGTLASTVIGAIGISQGGTGQTSASAAIVALSGLPITGGILTGGLTGTSGVFTISLSAPALSGIHYGDGSNLTGLTIGTYLSAGGGTLTGDLTGVNATFNSLSAASLSGNFYGDGSNLTGLTGVAVMTEVLSSFDFFGDGTTTTFDLSSTAARGNASAYIVNLNGALQIPYKDYEITYSTTNKLHTLFVPPSGCEISVVYLGNRIESTTNVSVTSIGITTPMLTADVRADLAVGGITVGQILSAGTTFQQFVEQLLTTIFYPTFSAPSASLNSSIGTSVEAGTTGITLTVGYSRGSINGASTGGIWNAGASQGYRGGAATNYTILGIDNNTTSAYTSAALVVRDGSNVYSSTVAYASGGQPIDSKGNVYSTALAAGSFAPSVTVVGKRNLYYGLNSAADNSDLIRILPGRILGGGSGTTFTITIPVGTTSIVIAYPESIADLTSVKDSATQYVITGNFAEIGARIPVKGANDYVATQYKVFRWQPAQALQTSTTYTVTI